MRHCLLKVVKSSTRAGQMSLRGPKGRDAADSIHEHVTAAGFADGEDVVLLSKADLERITDGCVHDAVKRFLGE